jgi:hypothetical protein
VGANKITFSFSSIVTSEGTKYFVGAFKNLKAIAYFDIVLASNGTITILQPYPDWIYKIQDQLVEVIKANS